MQLDCVTTTEDAYVFDAALNCVLLYLLFNSENNVFSAIRFRKYRFKCYDVQRFVLQRLKCKCQMPTGFTVPVEYAVQSQLVNECDFYLRNIPDELAVILNFDLEQLLARLTND